eukprot:Tamp_16962.p1 GENE.Tamp_16962~~Tamp_16962.p1  ORF type:complete len:172 (+),score=12.05 Tamp_16962:423-938(+)
MEADTLWAEWGRHLDALLESPGAELCNGAGALVSRLAGMGVPMGINTSSKSVAVAHKRKRHEQSLFRHMQCVVTGDDVSRGKPLPDSFLEAARRMNVSPQLCVAFEDSLPGVQSASAAGMRVYSVPDARLDETGLCFVIYLKCFTQRSTLNVLLNYPYKTLRAWMRLVCVW